MLKPTDIEQDFSDAVEAMNSDVAGSHDAMFQSLIELLSAKGESKADALAFFAASKRLLAGMALSFDDSTQPEVGNVLHISLHLMNEGIQTLNDMPHLPPMHPQDGLRESHGIEGQKIQPPLSESVNEKQTLNIRDR